jgi:hypothetical protein
MQMPVIEIRPTTAGETAKDLALAGKPHAAIMQFDRGTISRVRRNRGEAMKALIDLMQAYSLHGLISARIEPVET